MKIYVSIEGISPLLMNRFNDVVEVASASGPLAIDGGSPRATPREQAEKTVYRDVPTGHIYLPGTNLFSAIVEAGRFHVLGNARVTTRRSSLVPMALGIRPPCIPLGTKDFDVDSRRVRDRSTGEFVMRHRARIELWGCYFTILLDESVFTPAFVRRLVDDAGMKIGVGDFRPSTGGLFGRFVVTEWDTEQEEEEPCELS